MGLARSFTPFLLLFFASPLFAQQDLSGTVVDESGSALPRVAVTLIDQRDRDVATTFTDSRGVFHFARRCDGCAAIVSLPGFNASRAAVSSGVPIVLTLSVAPVEESVVVTATRSETPSSHIGAAVTVFGSDEIERRDAPVIA